MRSGGHGPIGAGILGVATALLMVAASWARGQAAADLSWKFREGQELTYVSRVTTSEKGTGENAYTSSWTHEIEHVDRVRALGEDGSAEVEREYTRVVVDVKHSRLGDARYDSMTPERGSNGEARNHPLIRPFAALAGRKVTFRVSSEGDVSEVRGLGEIMEGVFGGLDAMNPGTDLGAALAGSLGGTRLFTDEAFERQLEQSMRVMPGRRVRRGETWDVGVEQTMAMVGTMRSTTAYTFDRFSRERGRSLARVTSESEVVLDARSGDAGLLGISLRDGKGRGQVLIDQDLGAVRRWEQTLGYTFGVRIGLGGEESRSEVRIEQKGTMELISGDR